MTPERYQLIGELFDQALEVAPEQRAAWLDHATRADTGLRVQVEKLLHNHVDAGEFLSRPAIDVAAALLAKNQTTSMVGTQISHYSILSLLGVGGMGEVYLAKDTRLNRSVALKILPRTVAADVPRLRRFEQEAFAVSTLNHPNILTIFEFGAEGETHFIASEFVQGETLRERIQRDQPALSETLDLTLQIASALHAAHEVGIIHRDVKPENIMVRPDGIIKVLDFGLAKLTDASEDPVGTDSTPTRLRTLDGAVMGTTRYMSPEQARAWEVDARTDIFSLGVVLYELLAGRAPFEGPSANDVIVSILTREPQPICPRSPAVPVELERIIAKALAKDRDARYQSAKDLLVDVKGLRQRLEFEAELARSGTLMSLSRSPAAEDKSARTTARLLALTKRQKQLAGLTLGSLVATVVGLIFWLSSFGEHKTPALAATARITPFTTFSGAADQPAFSPDGSQIAFTWDGGNGDNVDLYVKLIGAGVPLRLTTDPAGDLSPAWSPDGARPKRVCPNWRGPWMGSSWPWWTDLHHRTATVFSCSPWTMVKRRD
jgi:serine/threonine protein kinase